MKIQTNQSKVTTVALSIMCCIGDWLILSAINLLIIRFLKSEFPSAVSNWAWILYQELFFTENGWFNPFLMVLFFIMAETYFTEREKEGNQDDR